MQDMARHQHPCGACVHYSQSVWQPVEGAPVALLARGFARRPVAEGEVLFTQGAPGGGVWCVSRGLFALRSYGPDGSSQLLRLAFPGDIVGFRSFLAGDAHRTEAQALVDSRVCVVARREAATVIEAAPGCLLRIARRCAAELDRTRRWHSVPAKSGNARRLARLLCHLADAAGDVRGDAVDLLLPLSRRDIGDMIGVQTETVSRLMGRLQERGLVRASGRRLHIPSIARLRATARRGVAARHSASG